MLEGVATNPDFLASRDGVPEFYLEATLAMPPVDPGADRRLAELHDTLDRMDSPDFFLEIQYRGTPEGNIPVAHCVSGWSAGCGNLILMRFLGRTRRETTNQSRGSRGPNKGCR